LTACVDRHYVLVMRYGWDPGKHAKNLAKHNTAFEVASGFDWETALVRGDTRESYGEVRLVALGAIGDRLYSLVFTIRRPVVWIMSLRKASRKEVRDYASES